MISKRKVASAAVMKYMYVTKHNFQSGSDPRTTIW